MARSRTDNLISARARVSDILPEGGADLRVWSMRESQVGIEVGSFWRESSRDAKACWWAVRGIEVSSSSDEEEVSASSSLSSSSDTDMSEPSASSPLEV